MTQSIPQTLPEASEAAILEATQIIRDHAKNLSENYWSATADCLTEQALLIERAILAARPPVDPLKPLTELSEELGLNSVQPPAGQQDRGEADCLAGIYKPAAKAAVDTLIALGYKFGHKPDFDGLAWNPPSAGDAAAQGALPPGRGMVPMSDEKIESLWQAHLRTSWQTTLISPTVFARAIEAHHGISAAVATPIGDGEAGTLLPLGGGE